MFSAAQSKEKEEISNFLKKQGPVLSREEREMQLERDALEQNMEEIRIHMDCIVAEVEEARKSAYFTLVEPLALPMRPLTLRIPRLSLLLSVAARLGLARTLADPSPLFMALGVLGLLGVAGSLQSGSSYIP